MGIQAAAKNGKVLEVVDGIALVVAFLVLPALTVGLVGYPLVRMVVAEDRAALRHVLEREVATGTLTAEELVAVTGGRCVRRRHLAAARTPQERAQRAASLGALAQLGAQLRRHPRSSTYVVEARARLDTIRAAAPGCRHPRSVR